MNVIHIYISEKNEINIIEINEKDVNPQVPINLHFRLAPTKTMRRQSSMF